MRKWIVGVMVLTITGCGFMEERESRTLAAGYTPCNDAPNPEDGVICHPNQYCASQKHNWCYTGCLSDDNCSHEQICVKSHSNNYGACMEAATLPDPNPDLKPGYTQCGDPYDPHYYEICQPSQYCYSSFLGDCSGGCLSEENCTDNQICAKEAGENVGVCVPAG